MTHPTLYLSFEDNKLHIFDMPELNKVCETECVEYHRGKDCLCIDERILYHKSVKQAIAKKVIVKDQEQGWNILRSTYQINDFKNDTPYPISGYSVTKIKQEKYFGKWEDATDLKPTLHARRIRELAILTPVKEEKPNIPNQDDFETEEEFFAVCRKQRVESADNATASKETIIEPIYDWATEEEYFKLFMDLKKVQEGLHKISISDNLNKVKYIANDLIKMLSFTLDKVDELDTNKLNKE